MNQNTFGFPSTVFAKFKPKDILWYKLNTPIQLCSCYAHLVPNVKTLANA